MPIRLRNILIEIISAILILLFVYTASSKLIEWDAFKSVLSQSPLIGNLSYIIAWLVPAVELIMTTFLFIPRFRSLGLLSSFTLLSLFTLYIGYMIVFTPNLPCSCGGVIKQLSWGQHLVFNIIFMILALTGYLLIKMNKRFIAINRISRTPV